ncbi:MAG: sporulation protein YunB [Clostridia bacterium]|nr:sporulation protein YunB [Clostridia bacterium]
MRYRHFYRRRNPAIFIIICTVIVFLISVLLIDAKIRPAVYDLATLEAYAISSERVNTAVEKILSRNAPAYSELVSINYSSSNAITGITTDIMKMNLFKSQVTNAIDSEFDAMSKTEIPVSLGTASGIILFSGLGPHIGIDVGFSSSTKTDFENIFESAGINQTQHSVMLNVETTVMLSLAGRRIPKTVETSFCVAQTVIVGSVPDVMVE